MSAATPPAIPLPTRHPGIRSALRALDTVVDGWPAEIFAGGVHQGALPGAPLVIADPALAQEVLVERAEEFPHGEQFNRLFRPVWGGGIFVSEGAAWRWQRRAAAPAFRPAHMHLLAPHMQHAAESISAEWTQHRAIELHQEMRKLTLRTVFDALLSGGEDFPHPEEASRHVHAFLDSVGKFALRDFLPIPAAWRGTTAHRGAEPAAYLRAGVERMIARRRHQPAAEPDLLSLLMDAEDPETGTRMDDTLLRDNLLGFMAAGTDTSSNALAWALWLIANHPAVEKRLVAEIAQVTGGGPISPEHIEALPFTRQVIQETQRLYPGAVALVRTAAQSCELGGRRIRKGALVQIAAYALHRRADLWDAPDRFDPDHFAPDRPKPSPGSYLPFGAGPRICMGAAFAMTEMVTALATIVPKIRLVPVEEKPVELGVRLGGLVGRDGIWMRPEPRTT